MISNKTNQSVSFEGEEAGAGYASPTLDLIATGFLVILAIIVMVASLSLPIPGDLRTAPGLLPFLTALSLLLMALVLGATALKRRKKAAGSAATPADDIGVNGDVSLTGTLRLAGIVGIYILSLQLLAFQRDFAIGDSFFSISAFEPVTIIALATIIHVYWRGSLWVTTLVSILWTIILSLVFQKAFNLPLPGSF